MANTMGYGQFCPVARAAEILAERWVPLVVRELLCGSVRFSDLQRGVPRMSSALLSRRLKDLEFAGILERRPLRKGRGSEYHLTSAGVELAPVVEAMGNWAQRWLRQDLVADENLDPDLLMWDVRRWVTPDMMPAGRRFTVMFEFAGVPVNRRRYWLVFDRGEVDLCIKNPGFDPDLLVAAHIRALVEVWLGHVSIDAALRGETLRLDGTREVMRSPFTRPASFRGWFALSKFAPAAKTLADDRARAKRVAAPFPPNPGAVRR